MPSATIPELNRIYPGDCLETMKQWPENFVDAVVTDPPYSFNFMGKEWDKSLPGVDLWREVLRVIKPGAHLLSFGGPRTYHRLTCAIEDAGFEIRDCIMWIFGSGFPKSLDVSKAIDKQAGAKRKVVGRKYKGNGNGSVAKIYGDYTAGHEGVQVTAPATDAARQWQGWGTALKPAHEPIVIARKPLEGTVAENVLKHGTGGMNIDGCRIPVNGEKPKGSGRPSVAFDPSQIMPGRNGGNGGNVTPESGRWPANVIHDGSEEVMAEFPETKSSVFKRSETARAGAGKHGIYGRFNGVPDGKDFGPANAGSAARFFYCAKSSRSERNMGLEGYHFVKFNAEGFGGDSCKIINTELAVSLQKATSESVAKWLTVESGVGIMGVCQTAFLSTTLTKIKQITISEILNSWTPSLISAFIAAANCAKGNGGNLAGSVGNLNQSQAITMSESPAESLRGARHVVSEMLSKISNAENWKPYGNFHATVKPLTLMKYLIQLVTPPKGIVFDPFGGSGTTALAAADLGFNFLACEMSQEYVQTGEKRIAPELAQIKLDL